MPPKHDAAAAAAADAAAAAAAAADDARSTAAASESHASEQLRAVALFSDEEQCPGRAYDRDAARGAGASHGGGGGGGAGGGWRPWWRRRATAVEALFTLAGAVLATVGVALQIWLKTNAHAFRWLYFFASLPVLWVVVSFVVRQIYVRIELAYFQELIYYWTALRFSTSLLAFTLLALPLYNAFFVWLWCGEDSKRACDDASYVKAAGITWNVLLCCVLFSLAHFLKSLAAKLISQHFYQTAHIAKVKQALEQEYYLLALSKPRPVPPVAQSGVLPSLARMSTGLGRSSSKPMRAASAPPPGVSRTGSARHEVVLHQQVEALLSSAAGSGASAAALARDSAGSNGSGSGPPLLPHPGVPQPRSWFWHTLFERRRPRPEPPAAVALAPAASFERLPSRTASRPPSRTGSGTAIAPVPEHQLIRVTAGSPGDEEAPPPEPALPQHHQHSLPPPPPPGGIPLSPTGGRGGGADWGEDDGAAGQSSAPAHAVAAKTFSALVRKYSSLSPEEEAAQLKLAGRLGKGLFENCRRDARVPGVTLDDFRPFFPDDATASRAFDFFDANGDGFISKAEMKEAVTAIVAERRDMATSLRDTDSIVASLEAFLAGTVHLLFIAFYLLVWHIDVMSGFSTFSATVLALTFVFGESVKNVFQSAVWLFLNHALDVGDTVMLPPDESWYRVKKFGLLDTVLVNDCGYNVHFPNSRLWSSPLVNLTRSGRRTEITRLVVDTDAPARARDALQGALTLHATGPGKGDFHGEPKVRYTGITPEGKARLAVVWTYAYGATDVRYAIARDGIVAVLKDSLSALGGATLHTFPIKNVPHNYKRD